MGNTSLLTVSGSRVGGTGTATENLKKQLPFIIPNFPEINGCHYGTINLQLEQALIVTNSDLRTDPIPWHPAHAPGEVFDILRIQLEAPQGSAPVRAWLYIAHHSEHRKNARLQEIIAPFCHLGAAARCRIHIDRPWIELPYRQCPTIVVL